LALPALAFSATSWKASNISSVCLSWSAASSPSSVVVQQIDQRLDVVAAEHGAEQLHGAALVDQRALASPLAMAARKPALT
jgi:hypothetical protein